MQTDRTAEVPLPEGSAAASVARAALRALLPGWGYDDQQWLYDATLIVSELVSNAVRHGGGCLRLRVQAEEGRVSLTVSDRSTRLPERRYSDEHAAGGRGIAFVDAFADTWGADVHVDGKDVWVRLVSHPH